MTYATLLSEEGVVSQYLVVIKPRRLMDTASWTLVGGTKYTQSFSLGQIVALEDDGAVQTEASSTALSDGAWYYDVDTATLYIDVGSDPANSNIVSTYELYLGTFDAHWYRNPLDNTTRFVYYDPIITKSPLINNSSTEDLFGFLPTISTSLTVSNTTQFLQEHVYESSFNNAVIEVYHYLDTLTVANTKLITSGFCGNVSHSEGTTSIEVFDNRALFENEFRHVDGMNFFASGTISGLDLDFEGRPVRKVFGVVNKFIPVNIDFLDPGSTTTNRDWVCMNPHDNLGSVTATVSASPASTTTRTYVDDADGLRVGDTVWLDKATDEYVTITVVNKTGSEYIEHAALVSGASAAADTVNRSFIGSVTIARTGFAPLVLKFKQDYTEYTDGTNKLAGFTLNDNFESNYTSATEPFNANSGSPVLEPSDLIFCRVYGNTNQETLGGPAFGSDSVNTGSLAQAIVIIYSILKNNVSLTEAEIDTTTFTSLQSSNADEVGFAIPQKIGDDFPKYKDLLSEIFQSLLLKFTIDDSNLYTIMETAPIGSVDKTIKDDEILKNSFRYNFDYKNIISDVIVEYAPVEVSTKNVALGGSLSYSSVTSTSNLATRLHNVVKQRTFQSLHFTASEAQILADRLKFALGDRRGRINLKTKNRFFDTELNDVITVTRTRLPGFSYDADTERSVSGAVISSTKALREIDVEIDDQKGIEDNSGSW